MKNLVKVCEAMDRQSFEHTAMADIVGFAELEEGCKE